MYFRLAALSRRWPSLTPFRITIIAVAATALAVMMLTTPGLSPDEADAPPGQEVATRLLAGQGSPPQLPRQSTDDGEAAALAPTEAAEEQNPVPLLVVAVPTDAGVPTTGQPVTSTADSPADPTDSSTPTDQQSGADAAASQSSPPQTPTSQSPGDGSPAAETSATEPAAEQTATQPAAGEPTTTGPATSDSPTSESPTTQPATTEPPTTAPPTTQAPSTAPPTTQAPTTAPPTTAPPTTGPQSAGSIQPCADPVRISTNPSSVGSALGQAAGKPCVLLELQPGSYSSISLSGLRQVTMVCSQVDGCAMSRIVVSRVEQLVVDGLRFTGGHDYGIMAYETERLLVQNSSFINASNGHDISLKNLVGYTEILNNRFVECTRHCLELGQNGNIRTRPSTSGVAVVRGNVFERPLINAITQRALCTLVIEDNQFIDVTGWAVQTWPYWAKYPFGRSGDDGTLYVPKCPMPKDQVNGQTGPMRTTISNNSFSGNARMSFEGRGVTDDTVEVTGNTGGFTCRFVEMADRTQAATADEETTAAPKLAAGSQC
jgi:hypothetical protein